MSYVAKIHESIELKIGKRSFELLYRSTDRVSVKDFHASCDSKGPTLTILYGKHNTIFGGYTSRNWTSPEKKEPFKDEYAFLFYTHDHPDAEFVFMPVKKKYIDSAITCHAKLGPSFGFQPLIGTFKGLQTFKQEQEGMESNTHDDYIHLNGSMNIGDMFDFSTKQKTADTCINSGTLIVKEIEVYQVIEEKFWRQAPTDDETSKMKKHLETFEPMLGFCIKQYNILLVGAVGAGKSSFYNTVATVFAGKKISTAPSGRFAKSVTNKIEAYTIKSKDGKILNFRIIDIRGFTDNKGCIEELGLILDGKLPVGYNFSDETTCAQSESVSGGIKDEIHLVCFVTAVSNFETVTNSHTARIQEILDVINKKGLHTVVVATQFDKLCQKIQEDVNYVYKSPLARDAVKAISSHFGIDETDIFPVVNYCDNKEINTGNDRLALQALNAMVCQTTAYLQHCAGVKNTWTGNVTKGRTEEQIPFLCPLSLCGGDDELNLHILAVVEKQYSVEKSDAWSKRATTLQVPKNKKEKDTLLKKLEAKLSEFREKQLRILCVGAVNCGKTNFIDSLASALGDDIITKATGGCANNTKSEDLNKKSTTKKFYQLEYKHESGDMKKSNVYIGDAPGFQVSGGIQLEDVQCVVKGLESKYGKKKTSKKLNEEPEVHKVHKVHCVCFLFDISTSETLIENVQRTLTLLKNWLSRRKIRFVVILTKCDIANGAEKKPKFSLFEDKVIKARMDQLKQIFGCKQKIIFPVINYTNEEEVDFESDTLLIEVLTEILKLGKERWGNSEDEYSDESDESEEQEHGASP